MLSALGAGGMVEVYRARATKLKCDVALKVLPESFVHDPDRLARFQRDFAQSFTSWSRPSPANGGNAGAARVGKPGSVAGTALTGIGCGCTGDVLVDAPDHHGMNRAVILVPGDRDRHRLARRARGEITRVHRPVVQHDAMRDLVDVVPHDHLSRW